MRTDDSTRNDSGRVHRKLNAITATVGPVRIVSRTAANVAVDLIRPPNFLRIVF